MPCSVQGLGGRFEGGNGRVMEGGHGEGVRLDRKQGRKARLHARMGQT
jgi:hypothetical protein